MSDQKSSQDAKKRKIDSVGEDSSASALSAVMKMMTSMQGEMNSMKRRMNEMEMKLLRYDHLERKCNSLRACADASMRLFPSDCKSEFS